MQKAQLFFLSNQYYQDFPDDNLMKNKDIIDGIPHNRPCFFAFPDSNKELEHQIQEESGCYHADS